ncbi:MAG: ATP-grasp domain-containing protein [Rhodocyclaceae bacterium]|nr:ATP-grasp domain-containing protein [Rhodocyclaceae bacterium]
MSGLRTVAVTGMNGRADNPAPGMAVVRCLRESGLPLRIIGLGYDALDPGLYSSGCDAGYLLPYPNAGKETVLERLAEIHAAEHLDAIIPCLDAELPVFVELESRLFGLGVRSLLPTREQLRARDKSHLAELTERLGIRYPETRPISDSGFFADCAKDGWEYPLVVKGSVYDAQVAKRPEEAVQAFRRIAAVWGLPILVQRMVEGDEFNLAGLGDGAGGLIGAVMMKKRAVTDKGKAWAGVTIHDERLLALARSVIAALRWRGPLEIEAMCGRDGNYYLIEINPRFPAWIYLSAGVGCNLPAALLAMIMGDALPALPLPEAGILFIRSACELIVPLASFESVMLAGHTPEAGVP